MSSVLKALKKLEKEKHTPSIKRLHGGRYDNEGTGRNRLFLYMGICFVSVVIFIMFVVISRWGQPVSPVTPDKRDQNKTVSMKNQATPMDSKSGVVFPVKPTLENKTESPVKLTLENKTEFPRKKDWIKKQNTKEIKAVSQDQKTAGNSEKPKIKTSSEKKEERVVIKSTPPSPNQESDPEVKSEPAQEPVQDVSESEIYSENDIQLQAIAWDSDPEKRIVVVNGNILHEKDNLNNGFIHQINSEYIILSIDDKMYRLNIND